MAQQNRQLASILFTDIVGYTAMMQADEAHAVTIMNRYVAVLRKSVNDHGGKILNDYGDGSLCGFSSATQSLQCSVAIQRELQLPPVVPLRIGLHIGEIFFADEKVMGDGVNIASRIQSLGQANTILFSKEIYDKIKNQQEFTAVSLGVFEFKNVDDPVQVFALSGSGLIVPNKASMSGKLKEEKNGFGVRKWIAVIGTVVLLALALFIARHYFLGGNAFSNKDKSIVVLPFQNYSSDSGEESFILGFTDEITTQLAKITDIKVIGRSSAANFIKSNKPMDQIAAILGVSAYLEGSVQKIGNTVRINARLIDANTQEHIWADRYDRDLKDYFSMQTEVAEQIALKLHVSLTPEEKEKLNKKPTENEEAHKHYLKGRFFWDKRTKESFDSAEANYNKAIELDPEYALAYAGLADLYIYPNNGLLQPNAIPVAKQYALKALSIDSTLSQALTTIGFIQSAYDYNWSESKKTLQKAIALNPNYPTAILYLGNLLQYTKESAEGGIAEIKKALSLDPLSVNVNYVLGRNYYSAGMYDSAYDQLKKTLIINPKFNLAKGNLIYVLLAKKIFSEAFQLISELDTTRTSNIYYYQGALLSYAYSLKGDQASAKKELEKTLRIFHDQSPYHLARAYMGLKDFPTALTLLEKAYDLRDIWMYTLNVDPTFDPMRNEPRFKALLKKMNLNP